MTYPDPGMFCSENQLKALRDFRNIAAQMEVSFMIIGATARLIMLDWKNGVASGRVTRDVDIAVLLKDWRQYETLRSALTNEPGRYFRKGEGEHRVIHKDGAPMDLIPFGGMMESDYSIRWPVSGHSMSVAGMQEAFDSAPMVALEEGLEVKVLSPQGLVLLKLLAWQERGLSKDLLDIDAVIGGTCKCMEESELFNIVYEGLISAPQEDFDYSNDALAFAMGLKIGGMSTPAVAELAAGIIQSMTDPYGRAVSILCSGSRSGIEDEDFRERACRRFRWLARGVLSGMQAP